MKEELFYKIASMAMLDNPFAEADEPKEPTENVSCARFQLIDDGTYPAHWRCEVSHICFVGHFNMFVEGNGAWLTDEDGEIVNAVRIMREIFAEMDNGHLHPQRIINSPKRNITINLESLIENLVINSNEIKGEHAGSIIENIAKALISVSDSVEKK